MGWDGGIGTRDDSRIRFGQRTVDGVAGPDNADEQFTGDVTRLAAHAQDEWNATMISVSASMRRIDNYTRTDIGESPADPAKAISMSINNGTPTTRGLEFEAKFPLKSLIASAPAIDLRANVSRNWSSVDAVTWPNNRLDPQAPFSSTLALDYKAGKLSTGGSYSFRNGGLVRVSDEQTVYSIPRPSCACRCRTCWPRTSSMNVRLRVTVEMKF